MSSFSYAMISSSGISPLEKMFAIDTYWESFDFRFSLSPSPGNQLNLTLAAVDYLEEFIDVCNVLYFHSDSPLSFLFLL